MPCRDYIVEQDLANTNVRQVLDFVSAMLCGLCQKVDNKVIATVPHLEKWWLDHQKHDKARMEQEKKQKEILKATQKALNKLTPEERKLLNLL